MTALRDDVYRTLCRFEYLCGENLLTLTDKVTAVFNSEKNTGKRLRKIEEEFRSADTAITKSAARKIVRGVLYERYFSEILGGLLSCDDLKNKISADREKRIITLTVHEHFTVETHFSLLGKTYINGRFFGEIEDQDLLEIYRSFVCDPAYYVIYKKRLFKSRFGYPDLKIFTNADRLERLKNDPKVKTIFSEKELLYRA